jgi:hypothetical protein
MKSSKDLEREIIHAYNKKLISKYYFIVRNPDPKYWFQTTRTETITEDLEKVIIYFGRKVKQDSIQSLVKYIRDTFKDFRVIYKPSYGKKIFILPKHDIY